MQTYFFKIRRQNPTHDLFLAKLETMYMLNDLRSTRGNTNFALMAMERNPKPN